MQLPVSLEFLRRTRAWQSLSDARYLRRHRTRRDFYRQIIRPGTLVFDIGANVGHYSLIFESIGASVLAAEPQAALATSLRARFRGHQRVNIVQTAIGAAPSTAVLHTAPGLTEIASLRDDIGQRSRFADEHPFSESETVRVTTLDLLITAHGIPAFCKIDVEGFELAVLTGLTRPLPLLSLEFNREFWAETRQCLNQLDQLGRYRFNYTLGETPAFAEEQWLESADICAALEKNSDPLLWGDLYARLS